jgi:type II secretory pathway pseudopilin PulG
MLRSILIGVAAAGLLIAGALTSLASNSHATTKAETRGAGVSALAKAADDMAKVAATASPTAQATAQAQAQTDVETETDTDTDTADEASDGDNNAQAPAENDKSQEHQGGGSDSGGND